MHPDDVFKIISDNLGNHLLWYFYSGEDIRGMFRGV
jgi:hypothetical protein